MKTDTYTKTILTIIAGCLVILVLKTENVFPQARATETKTTLSPLNYKLVPVNEDGSINVRLTPSQTIDVNIENISTSDQLDVNITEVGGYNTWGALPVKIKD